MVLKRIVRDALKYLEFVKFQERWRKCNSENYTRAGSVFPMEKVSVGRCTYGTLNVHLYKQAEERLIIGAYCSIADDTLFMLGGEHPYRSMFTYPFKNRVSNNRIKEAVTKGPIIIEDDVWIGCNSIILSGTKIGRGAIIGAGSVVRGIIPPYAIYAGGRVIKYRFSPSIVEKLLKVDISRLTLEKIEDNLDVLYENITEENVDTLIMHVNNLVEGHTKDA